MARIAAAECYGVDEPDLIVPAPGTQALIQALPRLRPATRVAVVAPTYNEHAHCWRAAGHKVGEVAGIDDAAVGADVVIVVNPNNPDGRRYDPAVLLALSDELAGRGGLMVVDEAFADVDPDISLASFAGRPAQIG